VLAQRGAELIQGDLEDRDFVDQVVAGVWGVFSVQTYVGVGVQREMKQGQALAMAAKDAGVSCFVYSSIGGADRNPRIGSFSSKWQVEQRIRALRLPGTILRPVFFTENLLAEGATGRALWGLLQRTLQSHRSMQMISVVDLGRFAALAFEQPERLDGQAIEIAGDEVTYDRVLAAFKGARGRGPSRFGFGSGANKVDPDIVAMIEWCKKGGFRADIDACRDLLPELANIDRCFIP